MWNYNEVAAYEDFRVSIHVVTFMWVQPNSKTISMISYTAEV